MVSVFFCFDDRTPVFRTWPAIPRIGDTVSLPELGGNLSPLRVSDVVWEGDDDEQAVTIYLQRHQSSASRISSTDRQASWDRV